MGVPKAVVKARQSAPAMMDEVVERLDSALLKVVSNKGAPGPAGMTVRMLREQWPAASRRLRPDLLEGRWRPGEVRRALIPKAGGGQRGLGIPNVVDRVVMEALRQVLEPLFEPTFHPSSHGFRPGRSSTRRSSRRASICRTAMSGWLMSIWRSSLIASTISG